MKIIPLSEAKARLSHYGRVCQREPVIVTINGVPGFQLVPLEEADELVDQLVEHNPGFRRMLNARLDEDSVPAKAASRRL